MYHNEKNVAHPIFLENFEINVVYFSKACALDSFSLDDFYTVTVILLLSVYANNLINYFFASIRSVVIALHQT